jgi:hypothetical protein
MRLFSIMSFLDGDELRDLLLSDGYWARLLRPNTKENKLREALLHRMLTTPYQRHLAREGLGPLVDLVPLVETPLLPPGFSWPQDVEWVARAFKVGLLKSSSDAADKRLLVRL